MDWVERARDGRRNGMDVDTRKVELSFIRSRTMSYSLGLEWSS